MSKRGTRCAGEARVIREAVARGWVRLERSSKNHTRLYWPPTKTTMQIPSAMDDGFARVIAQRLQKVETQTC